MKITRRQLQRIIQEELAAVLNEQPITVRTPADASVGGLEGLIDRGVDVAMGAPGYQQRAIAATEPVIAQSIETGREFIQDPIGTVRDRAPIVRRNAEALGHAILQGLSQRED